MKSTLVLIFSILTPMFAQADVHCSAALEVNCPPNAECINVDAVLGQSNPTEPSDDDSVE